MAEYARFFGGPEGSVPEYDQNDFSEVLKRIFSNGIFASVLNALEVTETDPISLAVSVNTGEGWIEGFWYQNSSALTKSLSAADPDNDRIDRIVLRLDTVTNFKISCEVKAGTPAASPSPPSLTQTDAIYEISLAQVLVEAGVTSVNNSKITDERSFAESKGLASVVKLTGDQTIAGVKTIDEGAIVTVPKTYTPAAAGTATLDLSLGNEHQITMPAGNITIAISNATVGQKFIVSITQDSVGSRTVTWFTTIRWVDGSAPTLTTTASKRDTFGFIVTGSGTYDGFIVGQNL